MAIITQQLSRVKKKCKYSKKILQNPLLDLNSTNSNKKIWGNQANAMLAGWILLLSFLNFQFYHKIKTNFGKIDYECFKYIMIKRFNEKRWSWPLNNISKAVFTNVNIFLDTLDVKLMTHVTVGKMFARCLFSLVPYLNDLQKYLDSSSSLNSCCIS